MCGGTQKYVALASALAKGLETINRRFSSRCCFPFFIAPFAQSFVINGTNAWVDGCLLLFIVVMYLFDYSLTHFSFVRFVEMFENYFIRTPVCYVLLVYGTFYVDLFLFSVSAFRKILNYVYLTPQIAMKSMYVNVCMCSNLSGRFFFGRLYDGYSLQLHPIFFCHVPQLLAAAFDLDSNLF